MESENIPDEIIYEILLRLPAESLLRFRTMSKLYRKTIDDPVFARTQYSLMGDKDPNLLFKYDENNNLRQLQVDGEFLRPRPGYQSIARPGLLVCSTNGFLLFMIFCSLSYEHKIGLISPLRREIIVLPPPKPVTGDEIWTNEYALGFDSRMEEYKIVCVLFPRYGVVEATGAEVYSSKTKSWKKTKNSPLGQIRSSPVFLNESIYWLCYHNGDYGLLSFDFETEEFRFHSKINLPSYMIPADLVELGGYLVLGDYGEVRGSEHLQHAWTLIENDWQRMDVIDIDPQPPLHEFYYVVTYYRNFNYLVTYYRSFYYLHCDGLELRSSKKFIRMDEKSLYGIYRCKRTLISLKNF